MKTFLQIFFLVIVSFLNSKLLSQTNTILCQQWLLDEVHEFADNDIYNCTDKGSFSIREIEFEGVKYIQIYGYYGTFGVAYNYKGKIFTLDGDLIHAFDSDVNDGDCNPCNDIPYTESTDLYNCDQTYPSCSECSVAIEMVQGTECILPQVISTGEILYPCAYTNGVSELPSVLGFKTNIDYETYQGTGCTSFCQQGTAVSIGCIGSTDICGTHPDYAPLMALYNATNGSGWNNNTGWIDGAVGTNCDPCNGWYGVTCTNGRVTCLDLDGNPDCQGFCSHNGNNLNGVIPNEIQYLDNLTNLHLGRNMGLTGSIPTSLGNLTNLTYLSINCSGISGSIPNELTNLTSLDIFWLHHNPNLTGPIPTGIGNMVELNEIAFNDCNLAGEIPASLGNLAGTAFYLMFLQNNNLSGCIPVELQSLCPNVTTFGNISGNPLLVTQSWTNFCASQEGMCTSSTIEDANEQSPFYVFPNPTYDRIYISQSDNISQLEVMSIEGKLIFTEPFSGHEINVSDLLPGVYILKLIDKEKNLHILKFVKSNL